MSRDGNSEITQPQTSPPGAGDETPTQAPTVVPRQRGRRATLQPGLRIGRYQVESLLGSGGMGSVYAAMDPELQRRVAIKVLHPHLSALHERLRLEGQAIAKLRHPNVIAIHDLGSAEAGPFIAMDLIAGQNLAAWLATKPPWQDVVARFTAAGRGLAAAHAAQLVHRDFKPDNVLLGHDGTVVVTDFGLAQSASPAEPIDEEDCDLAVATTQTGGVVGTPAYMAPEQFQGEPVTARSDQFSFCVALYEALHGRRPFAGATFAELCMSITSGPRPAVRARDVPPYVSAAIARGLSIDPAQRFASMDELLAALAPPKKRARTPWIVAGAAVAIAAAAAGAWLLARGKHAPELQLASPESLAATVPWARDVLVVLRDGRIAHMADGELTVSERSGVGRTVVPLPDGHEPVTLSAEAGPQEVILATRLAPEGCTYWLVSLAGKPARALDTDSDCGATLAVTRDDARLATARDNQIAVRELASGRELWRGPAAHEVQNIAWSPSARYIAVVSPGGVSVLDAGGRELVPAMHASDFAWLEDDRLVVFDWVASSSTAVSVIDVEPFAKHVVQTLDGRYRMPSIDSHGIAAQRDDEVNRVFVTSATPDAPIDLDRAPVLDTGAQRDLFAFGWTANGDVVTLSRVNGDAAILRTPLGGRGRTLVTFHGEAAPKAVLGTTALYETINSEGAALHALDVDTAALRTLWAVPSGERRVVEGCTPAGHRCLYGSKAGARWFDAFTGELGPPAPELGQDSSLSPDGTQAISVEDDHLLLRSLAPGAPAPTRIVPQPALSLQGAEWAPDGSGWFVAALDAAPHAPHAVKIVRLAPDGSWRLLVSSAETAFAFVRPSPDGSRLAISSIAGHATWQYLSFH